MALLRLFISLPLPIEIRTALGEFIGLVKPWGGGARWEKPDKLHLTVKFLGDTDDRLVGEILGVIRDRTAGLGAFSVCVSGFGAFPALERPRVIWVGCEDSGGTLLRIHDAIDEGLAALGFPKEERAFHPHVTLARVREQGSRTHLTSLPKNITFDPRHTLVSEIFLMKSVLQPAGSDYTVIGSSRLS